MPVAGSPSAVGRRLVAVHGERPAALVLLALTLRAHSTTVLSVKDGLCAVIIGGGRGERFWPASRRARPKQFLRLFADRSLIELTSQRIQPLCPRARQYVVVPRALRAILRKTMPWLKPVQIISEPVGRNTAPAIALASFVLRRQGNPIQVVLPADHLIEPRDRFLAAVRFAERLARAGYLVLFGIPPDRPEAGYGYIRTGRPILQDRGLVAHVSRGFREKPDPATARRYLRDGSFLWNSGMFVWQTSTIIEALRRHTPALGRDLEAWQQGRLGLDRVYARARSTSIDYAVLEKAQRVAVVRAPFRWDDVGSWLALGRQGQKDLDNNSFFGRFCAIDTRDSIIYGEDALIGTLGVRDLIVVQSGNAVLVMRRDRAGDVKKLLVKIEREKITRGYL